MSVLNLIVVGYGGIGPRHCQSVDACIHTNLFAIIEASPTPERRHLAQSKFPNTCVFESIQECIDSGVQIDGAIVCTPNHTHFKVSKELIEAGINVLVEKPMCPSLEDAMELKLLAQKRGVKLLVGHHRRFNPFVVATKNNLPRLGQIVAFDAAWCLKKCDEYFEETDWRGKKSKGGGVIQINVVHDLDLLMYFLGPLEEVYATEVKKTRQNDDKEDAVEEGVILHLTFTNGVKGTMVVCDNVVAPNNFEMGTGENPLIPQVNQSNDGIFYRFFGTRGSLSVPDLTLYHQQGVENPGWWKNIKKETLGGELDGIPFALQIEHFARVIIGQEEPKCTANDGIRVMLAIEAVKESVATGLPAKVPPLTEVIPSTRVSSSRSARM